MSDFQFRVLGPLEVARDGELVSIGRARERQLLCVLLANAGQTVSAERLTDALWGEDLPANPLAALQTSVSRLRGALTDESKASPLVTRAPGYALEVDPDQIDAERFSRLISQSADTDAETAATLIREALRLWRGQPYPEVAYHDFAQPAIRRLEQLRLAALERRVASDLKLGAGQSLVSELEGLVTEFPHHELLWGHLMVALYRAGRQADALATFQRARSTLLDELGLDPGPRLRRLEESILMQDPALDSPAEAIEIPGVQVATLPRGNVPIPLADLIGRDQEIQQTVDALKESRLVTLVGPAGVGKSRLAIAVSQAVGSAFADGIDMAVFDRYEAEGTPQQRFLRDLGIRATPEEGTRRIIALSRGREMLQILDGCETIIDEIAEPIRDVLASCPGVKILVTSRRRVGLAGETVIPLHPLDIEGPAAQLFTQRARALHPSLEITPATQPFVQRIVEATDGLPLGIELAAGRVGALPLEAIADELEERIDLLTTRDPTAPAKHRSLAAAIDISWNQLPDHLQQTLMRVAILRAPWDLKAAATICGVSSSEIMDRCVELSERSLIVPFAHPGVSAGFVLLNSVQTFALQRLDESGDRDDAVGLHAEYHLRFAEEAFEGTTGIDQGVWLQRIERRIPDLRAAFAHVRDQDPKAALDLAINLTPFFSRSGRYQTGIEILLDAIASNPDPTIERARALVYAGAMQRPRIAEHVDNIAFTHPFRSLRETWGTKENYAAAAARAIETLSAGIELYEEMGMSALTPLARISLAEQLAALGDHEAAREQYELALVDGELPDEAQHRGLVFLANLAIAEGDNDLASEHIQQELGREDSGTDAWLMIESHDVLARIAESRGDWAEAYDHYLEALERYANPNSLPGTALLEAHLGLQAARLDDGAAAGRHTGRALRLARSYGLNSLEGWIRIIQANGQLVAERFDNALQYVDHAMTIFEAIRDVDRQAGTLALKGMIEDQRGEPDAAADWHRKSLELGRKTSRDLTMSLALIGMAAHHHRKGDGETATAILEAALTTQERLRYSLPAHVPNSRLMPALKDYLGEPTWKAARERGAALTLDEAIELALS